MLKLKRVFAIPYIKKCFCTSSTPQCFIEHVKQRSLISVIGEEAPIYLQGMITNDIQHLSVDHTSQYAIFLNPKGRVLYDSIIYRIDSKTYFVECDSSIVKTLEKHLKMYRLRRNIDVITLNDYKIYTLFDKANCEEIIKSKGILKHEKPLLQLDHLNAKDSFHLFRDPRVSQLGYRILSQDSNDIQSTLCNKLKINLDVGSNNTYRKYRYSLGIGEGVIDLPPGNCFPLESNSDYLHGVSFHKGCYIGQELTARTYHTGVTRKRLMPVYFTETMKEMPIDESITNDKVKLGKLRGVEDNVGLALLRIDLIGSIQNLKIGGIKAEVGKPFWWPIEAPKEKLSLKKF